MELLDSMLKIIQIMPLTRAESHPLSVMGRFVKLLTVLLPAPIYYQYDDEIEAPASVETVDVPVAASPSVPTTTTTVVSTSVPVAGMEDVPIKAIDILLVIVAQHHTRGYREGQNQIFRSGPRKRP